MQYTIKRYKGAKHVRVGVNHRGEVVVTAGKRIPKYFIEAFVQKHSGWIREQLAEREAHSATPLGAVSREAYVEHKEVALSLVHARLEHFNQHYGFAYNRVFIRDTSSRWGSCSSKRNLSFSYKIVHLPAELADYIIVHELCHLKEMNHSPRFWALVAQMVPNYAECRTKLRKVSHGSAVQ